jgi:hypothetical protein
MHALDAFGAGRTDSSTGTPVSLVVPGQAPPPPHAVAPGHRAPAPPPHHTLPFSGFELVPVLTAAALLMALGALLTRLGGRPAPAPRPLADRRTP